MRRQEGTGAGESNEKVRGYKETRGYGKKIKDIKERGNTVRR